MSKIKLIFIFILFFILSNNINALSNNIIKYSSTLELPSNNQANNIIGTNEYYFLITQNNFDTIVYKYNYENNLLTSKYFPELISSQIIKYQDNYLLIGKSHNNFKIYYLDNNLRILSQSNSSLMISPQATLNLYNKDNIIYIMLTNNELLYDNQIYEVNENLDITSNNLSSYNTETLKEILHSDYYLIHRNDMIIENNLIHYYDTTYTSKANILIGTKQSSDNQNIAILTIINQEEKNIEYSQYTKFLNIELINDKLLVTAQNQQDKNYLVTIDYNGNILSEEPLSSKINKIYKVGNKLSLITDYQSIIFYEYQLNIRVNSSQFSTINIPKTAMPYEKVELNIKTNSGYEVDNITIIDEQGQVLSVSNNEFIMPENDVNIDITYKETVTNPETIDIITISILILLVISIILVYSRHKLQWLK